MRLREYLDMVGIPITKFARRVQVTPATIHNLLKGRQITLRSAVNICEATKGEVTIEEILEESKEKKNSDQQSQKPRKNEKNEDHKHHENRNK
jgi:DNA-binding transcriptional regulator YdaS (Cro superfamily)